MARIVYFASPFDETKQKEMRTSGQTILDILKHYEIEKQSLCVTINGETPDDCDMAYVPTENDVVEIRKMVHGNSASSKRGLAAFVQIVAIIVATVLSQGTYAGYAVAVLAAGSVISAALNKRAMELMQKGSGGQSDEVSVEANSFSLANSNNEARPLSPLPLPMGSHRFAPDVHTDSFQYVFLEDNIFAATAPIDETFYPGIDPSNGAHSSLSWAIMPANYIAPDFPQYDIKIAPYHFRTSTAALTPTETTAILNEVKARYLPGGGGVGTQTLRWWDVGSEWSPLVIYHHTPADPYYQRYNLMHFLARLIELDPTGTTYPFDMGDIFAGTNPFGAGFQHFASNYLGPFTNYDSIKMIGAYYYPSTVGAAESSGTLYTKYGTWLLSQLNGGSYAGNKTLSYVLQKRIETSGLVTVNKTGIRASEQVFNFGIGDFDISDRKVGGFVPQSGFINDFSEQPAQTHPIRKATGGFPQWSLDGISRQTLRIDNAKLINQSQPTTIIPVTDLANRNWFIARGKPGLDLFKMVFAGQLYKFSGGSITTNTSRFQVQLKYSNESIWEDPSGLGARPVFSIENNNTRKITWSLQFLKNKTWTPGVDPEPYLEVRMRKISLESTDNQSSDISDLGVEFVAFIEPNTYFGADFSENAPMNLEKVRITEQYSVYGTQYKFSALVEAKCWVYDADLYTWTWEHTRNPAWWFLYFARGGFFNIEHDDTDVYPYSPTWGWVNYPGHPDSTEQIFGVGLFDDQIDMDKIKEWAEFCDDNDLKMDLVLKDDISCSDALERIANVGRASSSYYKGKLSVIIENPEQIPTCLFGMGNILAGTFSVDYTVGDPVAKVIGKFTDRGNWEAKQVEADVPFAAADNIKEVQVTLEGITDEDRAQREVNLLAARQYYQRRLYTWGVDIEALLATRGDLVYLSHDSTQYGFSGRIRQFILQAGNITGFLSTAILDTAIEFVTIKEPNGAMNIYACHVEGETIVFDDPYPIEKASFWINNTTDNADSDYPNSIPEDWTFISGAKATPGKLVRISEIQANPDNTFTIKAVDEDPAMWAYEYEDIIDPESFDNSEVVLSLKNVHTKDLGNGFIKVYWESVNGDFLQIINEGTGLPIEANGAYSFTGGEVTLELVQNQKYILELKPFAIGTPFKSVSKRVRVWPR